MFAKIALIIVLFAPNGNGYKDIVALFDTVQECETERARLLKDAQSALGKEPFVFSACSQPRSLGAVDI